VPAVDDPPLVASAEGWAIRLEIGHGVGDAVLTQPDLVTRLATAHDVVAASDDDWTALCLADHLATVLRLRGDFDDMERVHAEALARVTSPELDWWRVEILFRQASTFERNDPQRAADLFAEALAVAARVGHEQHVVQLRVDVLRGDIDGARRHAGEIYTRRIDAGPRSRPARPVPWRPPRATSTTAPGGPVRASIWAARSAIYTAWCGG